MFSGSTSLNFYKRLNVYKNSTNSVSFNPETNKAFSYRWNFLSPLPDGSVFLNCYKWSPTTSHHQSAVRSLMRQLKIKVIECDLGSLTASEINAEAVFKRLLKIEIELSSTRAESYKSGHLRSEAAEALSVFQKLQKTKLKVSRQRQQELREAAYNKATEAVNEDCFLKACKELDKAEAQTNFEPVEI